MSRCCSSTSSVPGVDGVAINPIAAIFSLAGADDQGNPASFAVPDKRDSLRIDIASLHQIGHNGARVDGELFDRGRLLASSALARASLVVAHDQIARIGERVGQLGEDRNAGDELVTIGRPGARHEHNRGKAHRSRLSPGRPAPARLARRVWKSSPQG